MLASAILSVCIKVHFMWYNNKYTPQVETMSKSSTQPLIFTKLPCTNFMLIYPPSDSGFAFKNTFLKFCCYSLGPVLIIKHYN